MPDSDDTTGKMLEGLDLDDLAEIADSLPGPHSWTHGTLIFVCQACYVAFEFGADPVPQGPCEPLPTDGQTGAGGLR
jgi:hypothetical protein